jgi:hypothetical protein
LVSEVKNGVINADAVPTWNNSKIEPEIKPKSTSQDKHVARRKIKSNMFVPSNAEKEVKFKVKIKAPKEEKAFVVKAVKKKEPVELEQPSSTDLTKLKLYKSRRPSVIRTLDRIARKIVGTDGP